MSTEMNAGTGAGMNGGLNVNLNGDLDAGVKDEMDGAMEGAMNGTPNAVAPPPGPAPGDAADPRTAPVRRRHVFFLSGFDPKGASYYHGLYRTEAVKQGQVTGVDYRVGERCKLPSGNTQWRVESRPAGGGADDAVTVTTTFEFVRWDDIVRAQWPRNAGQVLRGSVRGYAAVVASWARLGSVYRASPRTLIALVYPLAFWLGALLAGLLLGLATATGVRAVPAVAAWGPALPWAAGAAVLALVMAEALRRERRLNTSWLLRIYQFAGDWAGGRVPLLHGRIDGLAGDIAARVADPAVDEVLVVGFSVGSMLAASGVARAQARMPAPPPGRLTLMTLGHCIPLLGLMPGAGAFRAELGRLGGRPAGWPGAATPWAVDWTDFSSPSDWGSFALVDPLALCLPAAGRNPAAAPPRMASPRFHTLFRPDSYAVLRRDKRALHLQYLRAGELAGPPPMGDGDRGGHSAHAYDYFAITAGPRRLPAPAGTTPQSTP